MLKQLFELAERLLGMTRDIQGNQEDIRRLDGQIAKLTTAVQELAFELRRLRESELHEREKIALRLENAMLQFERKLLNESHSGRVVELTEHSEVDRSP